MLGYKGGQQAGDIVVAHKNLLLAITTNFFAGQRLDDVRKSVRDFILKIGDKGIFFGNSVLLLTHITSLQKGPDAVIEDNNLPSESEILADPMSGVPSILAFGKVHNLIRAFLFRQMFDATLHIGISEAVAEECHLLKTYFVMGYFFEGLASFQLARLNKSATAWVDRGRKVLERLRCWSGHSSWNWENKYMLLEAENKYTEGDFASAESLYDSAIQSAHAHAFIHEEAIACELAGAFYHERGFHQESYPYFMHSIKSYNEWGAFAVARRVETFVRGKFRTEGNDQADTAVTSSSLDHLFVFSQCSKKRFGFGE